MGLGLGSGLMYKLYNLSKFCGFLRNRNACRLYCLVVTVDGRLKTT